MKSVKYTILILLCCFLLSGCTETDSPSVSSSTETDNEYSETNQENSETERKNTKQKKKKIKKKKQKKNSKKDTGSSKKSEKKGSGEYSTGSDAVEQAKNSVCRDFYNYYNYTEEVTCGEVLNYYFDYTQWLDVTNDDFEGVEFIGTKYEDENTWEIHLYYSFDGGFLDNWLGGAWLGDLKAYKNEKREEDYEYEVSTDTLMVNAYLRVCEEKSVNTNLL